MVEHIKIKPEKCKACRRCEVACIAAHHNMPFKEAMKHRDTLTSRVQVVKAEGIKTSVRCHQCNPAPCAQICPVGALSQDEDGRITMNEEQCISCKMCVAACPYGSITLDTFVPKALDSCGSESCPISFKKVAVRCDMCHSWRLENGKKITACMEACPVRALYLVEANGEITEMPEPEKKTKSVSD